MCLTIAIRTLATAHACCYRVETPDGDPVQNTVKIRNMLDRTQRRPLGVILLAFLCTFCWICSFLCIFLIATVISPHLSDMEQNLASLLLLIPGLCGTFMLVMGFIEYRVLKRKQDLEMNDMYSLRAHEQDEDSQLE